MNYRLASSEDTADIRKLWEYCFDDSDEFNDWFFENRYQPQNTLVASDNGHIASALQLLPYTIQLRDQQMVSSYIVGVSTWPEDRGKGHVTHLLRYALEEMRRREQWISILLPFKYEFYRKYGWETCYSHVIYSGSVEAFNSYCGKFEVTGQFRPVNKAEDICLLNKCYLQFAKGLNGYVLRDSQDWDRVLNDIRLEQGHMRVYVEGEYILGYIIYYIQDRQFFIRELAFADEKSKLAILRFVLAHSDIIDQIQWKAPYINEERLILQKFGISYTENPFVMGRIVDVTKTFEQILGGLDDIELDITLKVVDRFLEWNNQTYDIKSSGEETVISSVSRNPDAEIDIKTLAQLLWGYVSPGQAIDYNMVKVFNPSKVQQIISMFPKVVPYIYEDY